MRKRKRSALLPGALSLLLALVALLLLGRVEEKLLPAPPSSPLPVESLPPTPVAAETLAETVHPEEAAALAAAESIRSLYTAAYDPANSHLGLPAESLAPMLERLAGTEAAAVDVAREWPLQGDEHLRAFAEGRQDFVRLYELCPDGGFICHALVREPGGLRVTQTRLFWAGTEPGIGYCDSYEVTVLSLTDSRFYYEYFMPDNIPGGNHDGHVDTWLEILLA